MTELDRAKLIEDHLTFAGQIASQAVQLCPFDARQELKAAGIVGLVEAAQRYRPEDGATFKTYAAQRIRGAVLDAMRAQDILPRSERARVKKGLAWDPGHIQSLENIPPSFQFTVKPLIDSTYRVGSKDPRWQVIASVMKQLGKRERRMLVLAYGHDMTLKEIGEKIGMSESGVCRLRERVLAKIRRAVGEL